MITASLPDLEQLDLEAAKALLVAQHKIYVAALSSRGGEIERLRLLVEKLQRMLFGTKSEKVLRQIEQLELQLEELQAGCGRGAQGGCSCREAGASEAIPPPTTQAPSARDSHSPARPGCLSRLWEQAPRAR